jgi:hypothetical protein
MSCGLKPIRELVCRRTTLEIAKKHDMRTGEGWSISESLFEVRLSITMKQWGAEKEPLLFPVGLVETVRVLGGSRQIGPKFSSAGVSFLFTLKLYTKSR